jgi:DNA-binding response OmpR family regulator
MTTHILTVGIEPALFTFLSNNSAVTNYKNPTMEELCEVLARGTYDALVVGSGAFFQASCVAHIRSRGHQLPVLRIELGPRTFDWSHRCATFLDAGGDNMIVGPAEPEEVLRLTIAAIRLVTTATPKPPLRFSSDKAEITIDDTSKKVSVNGVYLCLTAQEYNTLCLIATHQEGLPNSRLNQLLYGDHGEEAYLSRNNMVQIFICRLRKKLAPHFTITNARKGRPRDSKGTYKLHAL